LGSHGPTAEPRTSSPRLMPLASTAVLLSLDHAPARVTVDSYRTPVAASNGGLL